ncbi:hypothetical protein R6Q59_018842 [Mikania micrantha]
MFLISQQCLWSPMNFLRIIKEYMKLRNHLSVKSMSDKSILKKVLGRSYVCLHGWRRDPSICSTHTCTNQKSKHLTYNELEEEVETSEETRLIVQQIFIEKNLMSSLQNTT